MTAKKRWLLQSCEDQCCQTNSNNVLNISWSSSNSENDYDCNYSSTTKKFKIDHNNDITKSWIKVGSILNTPTLNNKCDTINDTSFNENSVAVSSQFTCVIFNEEEADCKPSLSRNCSFKESPVIGTLKLEELSPVLKFSQNLLLSSPSSPTIGKKPFSSKIKSASRNEDYIKELPSKSVNSYSSKSKHAILIEDTPSKPQTIEEIYETQHLVADIENDSPVSSQRTQVKCTCSTQHSNIVIESDSPKSALVDTEIETASPKFSQKTQTKYVYSTQHSDTVIESDSTKSQNSQVMISTSFGPSSNSSPKSIDPFPSQQYPEIIFNTDPTETSSCKSSSDEPLYHEVSPKKKKKYKKNGLACQLQKALNKQKSDFAICRHELYLKRSKGYEVSSPYDESLVLLLKIIKIWNEFGITVVECEYLDNHLKNAETPQTSENCSLKTEQIQENTNNSNCGNIYKKQCLVIIGFNVTHSIRIKVDAKFRLFPPYMVKIVVYNGELRNCYFNVSKLFSIR